MVMPQERTLESTTQEQTLEALRRDVEREVYLKIFTLAEREVREILSDTLRAQKQSLERACGATYRLAVMQARSGRRLSVRFWMDKLLR